MKTAILHPVQSVRQTLDDYTHLKGDWCIMIDKEDPDTTYTAALVRPGYAPFFGMAADLKQQRDDLLAELIEAKKLIDNYVDAHQGDYGFTDETAAYNAMVRFNPKSIAIAQGKQ